MAQIRELEMVKNILFKQNRFVLWGKKDLIIDVLSIFKTDINLEDMYDGKNYVYLKSMRSNFSSSDDRLKVLKIFKSSKEIRDIAEYYKNDPEHYYDDYQYCYDYAIESPRINVENLYLNDYSSDILEVLKSIEKKLDMLMMIPAESMTKSKGSSPKSFIAISPSGEETEETNITKFAEEKDLNKRSISACINGRQKTHKGWRFKKEE